MALAGLGILGVARGGIALSMAEPGHVSNRVSA